jgi:hypothetical protein
MDKSEIETFQNIANPNVLNLNTSTTSSTSSVSNPLKNAESDKKRNSFNQQQQQMHPQNIVNINQPQICQICGVFLRLDSNILNMNENTNRQLSNQFSRGDDLDTTISGNMLDTDMEISMSALVRNPSQPNINNLIDDDIMVDVMPTSGGAGTMSNIESSSQDRLFEPMMYRRTAMPPQLHSTTTSNLHPTSSIEFNLNKGPSSQMESEFKEMYKITALFDIISSTSPIDHPLCEECADHLVNVLDYQCKQVEREHSDYTALINRLNQQQTAVESSQDLEKLEAELR